MEQLMPVLFSMPESDTPPSPPFKFIGGFAMSTKTIGFILSMQGFMQMIVQIFIFPIINRRFGNIWTFRVTALSYPFLYFIIPYLALLPQQLRMPAVYVVLLWKVTAQAAAYPSLNMMLANMAPSTTVLGTLNGAAASSASLCRAIGPILAGFLQSVGLDLGYSGLSWWVCGLIAVVGATESLWMKEGPKNSGRAELVGTPDEEAALLEPIFEVNSSDPGIICLDRSPEHAEESEEYCEGLRVDTITKVG